MPSWLDTPRLPSAPEPGEPAPDLRAYPLLAPLAACPQDPVHHGEGDVLAHTQLVCAALADDPEWRALDRRDREVLWLAAVLHDAGKPQTTREEDGRLRAPGHARAGAILARRLLWQAGMGWRTREAVCGLVRWHMALYHLLDRPDPVRQALALSLEAGRPDLLRLLVLADARGRVARDTEERLEVVELAYAHLDELGCGHGPYPFASDHARFTYFLGAGTADRDPAYPAFDDTLTTLTLLSGLPGAGKDRWIAEHAGADTGDADAEIISLDALRAERGAKRTDRTAQGQIVQEARGRLRTALAAGRPVVWNTTGLSRQLRGPLAQLAHDYRARVRIVCLETPPATLRAQNAGRADRDRVPEAAIERMLAKWEFPALDECHERVVVEQVPARTAGG